MQEPEFIEIYTKNERKIRMYVKRLVYHIDDAEDIMQATAMIIWKKFDQYNPEYPFISWAYKIAYNEIRNYYRKQEKKRNFFSEAVLDQLSATQEKHSAHLEDLRAQLQTCVAKLKSEERQLIEYRYCDDGRINDLADKTGLKANTISKNLQRIRRKLYVCVNNAQEAST